MDERKFRNPAPTVDVLIWHEQRLVLVQRKNPPLGWALPGGFIDEGEMAQDAAHREMKEETSLDIVLDGLLGVYSNPQRDPRRHTMSVVYVGHPMDAGQIQGGDDAQEARFFDLDALPELVFDHALIIEDFKAWLRGEQYLAPAYTR